MIELKTKTILYGNHIKWLFTFQCENRKIFECSGAIFSEMHAKPYNWQVTYICWGEPLKGRIGTFFSASTPSDLNTLIKVI